DALPISDTTYIPTGPGPAANSLQTMTETIPAGLRHHIIHYTYDDLYRLTEAIYSGSITATFAYDHDSVGNMTAYTETVGTESTHVVRTFDAANRLQTALDLDEGTTSYHYDGNGSLTVVYPPGSDAQNPAGALGYTYDRRNLLTRVDLSLDPFDGNYTTYTYDGDGNRLQQDTYYAQGIIYKRTTQYANDVVGLTQVLMASEGANDNPPTQRVYNLFGLDLISQDDGNEVRTLLVDGLGSVRTEMVDEVVETVTTYSPYGEVLEQMGTSGTVYGFTGEQEASATGLLYLRARYYDSSLKTFMSR